MNLNKISFINFSKLKKGNTATTMALGEEGGNNQETQSDKNPINKDTLNKNKINQDTIQIGNSKIGDTATTMALGEEGGSINESI